MLRSQLRTGLFFVDMLTVGRLHRMADVCEHLVLRRLLRLGLSSESVLWVLWTGCVSVRLPWC